MHVFDKHIHYFFLSFKETMVSKATKLSPLLHTAFTHHSLLLLFVFVVPYSDRSVWKCLTADCRLLDVGVSHQRMNKKKTLKRQCQPSRHGRAFCFWHEPKSWRLPGFWTQIWPWAWHTAVDSELHIPKICIFRDYCVNIRDTYSK